MNHPNHPSLPRREFLRLLGLLGSAAAVTTFLNACQKAGILPVPEITGMPEATASPTPGSTATAEQQATEEPAPTQEATETPRGDVARIAFVRTNDRAAGVNKAIDLLGVNPISGRSVFLKPNYNSADPAPGSTHPDVLRAIVLKLRELGAGPITVGDRSGMGDTRLVMQALGVFEMAEELGFETIVFDELGAEDWVQVNAPGSHWQQGFRFARPCLDCEAIVQACCLKTHRYGGHFTLSLKNSVGLAAKSVPGEGYNYMNELHTSRHQRRMIAEINAAYQPALVILDGVEGFANGGPDQGKLIRPEVVLAGSDRVAIDAVGVALLRYFGTTREVSRGPIFEQEQIARAVELGLGVGSPAQIELVTDDQASADFAEEIMGVLQQD